MPQFDPTFFPSQIFWLVVTFTLLYVLMARIALPRIGEVLDERQRKIDADLEKAAAFKQEAEAAMEAYEQALAESRAKAQAMLKAVSEEIAREAEQRHADLSAKLAQQIKEGEARVEAAKQEAMTHVQEVAIDVARVAAQHLAGISPSEAKARKAVDGILEETP